MVSDTVIAVLGTLGGAGITGLINYYRTRINQESQDRRRYSAAYVDAKVDYLTALHDALTKADIIINGVYRLPNDLEWRKYTDESREAELLMVIEDLLVSADQAQIFLDNEANEEIRGAIAMALMYCTSLMHDDLETYGSTEEEQEEFEWFNQYVYNSRKILAREISFRANTLEDAPIEHTMFTDVSGTEDSNTKRD